MEKFRSRNFNLILYEEDETHKKAINYIKKNLDYAMICHDRDIDEKTGEIKKPHWHVVIHFNNAKWNTALSEDLSITENYIEECRNLNRSLAYLIHYYDEEKYQYSIDDVEGSLRKRLVEYIKNDDKTESEKVIEILKFIDEQDDELSVSDLIRYCSSIGYWDVLRRASSLFIQYLTEHNNMISKFKEIREVNIIERL